MPVPTPAREEALIRVGWTGICGTDLEEYTRGPLTIPVTPHVAGGRTAPLTLGHEIVGTIAVAAEDGSGPQVGTWVVPDVVQGCGRCWWCRSHEEGLCPRLNVLGQTDDGGLAEFMVAKADRCLAVPAGLDPRLAALAEPVAVAVRAISKVSLQPHSAVVIIGGGTIGQLVAQLVARQTDGRIIVVDPVSSRRDLARRLSGAVGVAPDESAAAVGDLPEPGVDVVIECAGRPGLIEQALQLVRPGGTVVAVGLRSGAEGIDVGTLVLGERRLVGSAAHMWDTDVATALQSLPTMDVLPLVTHEFPLSATKSAFDLLAAGDPSIIKILISAR